MNKFFYVLCLVVGVSVGFNACTNTTLIDEYAPIENAKWTYTQVPKFEVNITDTSKQYNLYLNIRNEGNYKYNNIYLLFHITTPNKQESTNRFNFKLANNQGQWYGKSGIGDLYDCQITIGKGMKFTQKGIYTFAIEQNMRQNPLEGITDIGIKIEPWNQK